MGYPPPGSEFSGITGLYGYLLSGFGPVLLVAQIACLVHVLRSGRPYWWIWLIMGIPLIGVVVYLLVEVRPPAGRIDFSQWLWRMKSPDERIRIRREVLADSSTVRNRLAVADELRAAGRFDEESRVLADGLHGAFKDDSMLLMRLAQAQLDAGHAAQAEQTLAATTPERSSDSQYTYALLHARLDDHLGRRQAAERRFGELIEKQRSEAARYYYAEFLLRSGRAEAAAEELRDILHRFRRGTRVWRFQERPWYDSARKLLPAALTPTSRKAHHGPREG